MNNTERSRLPLIHLPKRCEQCQKEFVGRGGQRFCSVACRTQAQNSRWGRRGIDSKLSTATRGAISELLVAIDLLEKGYEVFRAVSAACSCDLAVLKEGKLLRIEVRTGYVSDSGKISTNRQRMRADILAIALPGEIKYEPPLLPARE